MIEWRGENLLVMLGCDVKQLQRNLLWHHRMAEKMIEFRNCLITSPRVALKAFLAMF